jgi:hypothetical protein
MDPSMPYHSMDPSVPHHSMEPSMPYLSMDPSVPYHSMNPSVPYQTMDPSMPYLGLDVCCCFSGCHLFRFSLDTMCEGHLDFPGFRWVVGGLGEEENSQTRVQSGGSPAGTSPESRGSECGVDSVLAARTPSAQLSAGSPVVVDEAEEAAGLLLCLEEFRDDVYKVQSKRERQRLCAPARPLVRQLESWTLAPAAASVLAELQLALGMV